MYDNIGNYQFGQFVFKSMAFLSFYGFFEIWLDVIEMDVNDRH